MGYRELVLFLIPFVFVQCIVIAIITRMNKDIFDKFPDARYYFIAISELAKHRPVSAFVIRLCYFLNIFEIFVVVIWKYKGG